MFKKRFAVLLPALVLCLVGATAASAEVAVDSAHFPDEAFRNYISGTIDADHNGILSGGELEVTTIILVQTGAASLQGIEFFPRLEGLYVEDNALTSLDLSHNPALVRLDCSDNALTGLDLSNNPALELVRCNNNHITSLDFSHNPALVSLWAQDNELASLNVSQNPAMTGVHINGNQLTSLDVSHNPRMEQIWCGGNQLTSLDVSAVTALKELLCNNNQLARLEVANMPVLDSLYCYGNPMATLRVHDNPALRQIDCKDSQLTAVNIYNNPALEKIDCSNNRLTNLDLGRNAQLGTLDCSNNQLTNLNVSQNAHLRELDCSNNRLPGLNVRYDPELSTLLCSGNQLTTLYLNDSPALFWLECQENRLTALDLSHAPALDHLECQKNQLATLDLRQNPALTSLTCSDNCLTSLDLSANTALETLWCTNNQLSALDLSANRKIEELYCGGNRMPYLDLDPFVRKTDSLIAGSLLTDLRETSQTVQLQARPTEGGWQVDLRDVIPEAYIEWVQCDPNLPYHDGVVTVQEGTGTFRYDYWTAGWKNNRHLLAVNVNYSPDLPQPAPAPQPTGVEAFVTRLYQVCLDRTPQDGEESGWVAKLSAWEQTGAQVAHDFIFSQEFLAHNYSDADYVRRLYMAFMGREAEPEGLDAWLKAMQERGETREQVFDGFGYSKEFAAICASYGIDPGHPDAADQGVRGFVARLYAVCLDRTLKGNEGDGWITQLSTGEKTGAQVAHDFIFSPEFTAHNYSDDDYVRHLYLAFMGREAEQEGLDAWLRAMQERGESREQVFNGFGYSDEFAAICTGYGIVP